MVGEKLQRKKQEAELLRVEQLKVCFDGHTLLEDLSFALSTGGRVILTGASGSGKSTLCKCLFGFTRPSGGAIFWDGHPLDGRTVWAMRRRAAFVPQEPLLGSGCVEDFLSLPFSFKSNHALTYSRAEALELCTHFRLAESILKKDVSSISGGEKQRVAVIAAILLKRELYVLDEPVSAMDRAATGAILDFFRERKDLAVLAALHEPNDFPLEGRIIHLPEGASKT